MRKYQKYAPLAPPLSGLVRGPDIHVDVRHPAGVDRSVAEVDRRNAQTGVVLDVVSAGLGIRYAGLVRVGGPGCDRFVVVGAAKEGDHVCGWYRGRGRGGGRDGGALDVLPGGRRPRVG